MAQSEALSAQEVEAQWMTMIGSIVDSTVSSQVVLPEWKSPTDLERALTSKARAGIAEYKKRWIL